MEHKKKKENKLTNASNKDGVRKKQAVVDLGELELVPSEPVRHLRFTFIPNNTGISQWSASDGNLETSPVIGSVPTPRGHSSSFIHTQI